MNYWKRKLRINRQILEPEKMKQSLRETIAFTKLKNEFDELKFLQNLLLKTYQDERKKSNLTKWTKTN